jgi:septal ring factor EnvC (AmiA/AmiB activator)
VADETKKVPTWGYHAVEPARIFHLKPGEKLPEGWADTPAAFANAQAQDAGDAAGEDSGASPALEAAHARIRELEQIIEQGRAENAELREELKGADEEADEAAAQVKLLTEERDTFKAQAEKLAAENEQLRAGHVAPKKGK